MNLLSTLSQLSAKQRKCGAGRLAVLASLCFAGCYNANALVEQRRDIAIQTQLQEIDLGRFHVSVPRPSSETAAAEILFHVFGQVTNRDLKRTKAELEKNGPEIRHQLLLAARSLTIQDLEDPKLSELRKKIATIVNKNVEGEPLHFVGFYQFRFSDL